MSYETAYIDNDKDRSMFDFVDDAYTIPPNEVI